VKFKDGVQVLDESDRNAAWPTPYTTFDNSSDNFEGRKDNKDGMVKK